MCHFYFSKNTVRNKLSLKVLVKLVNISTSFHSIFKNKINSALQVLRENMSLFFLNQSCQKHTILFVINICLLKKPRLII